MGGSKPIPAGAAERGGHHNRVVVFIDGAGRRCRGAHRERPHLRERSAAHRAGRIRPAFIQLPAFVAALLGLGLNYAAYESEIYRGALEAVPTGQLDAARTLGFSERQILVLVRAPQAFRLALAPMTNDFVALLKDSSLVSVITVVELTKETSIFAANIGSWVVPGIMCAAIYLAMSLPLARLARRIERRLRLA